MYTQYLSRAEYTKKYIINHQRNVNAVTQHLMNSFKHLSIGSTLDDIGFSQFPKM